jgi:hypothetical protein
MLGSEKKSSSCSLIKALNFAKKIKRRERANAGVPDNCSLVSVL